MKFIHLYMRVLELLGREAALGWMLALANLALACAMFVEPILFGRIVDTLANAQGHFTQLSWSELVLLVGAWVAFGLFIIVCSTLVSLHADRLAHRQYQAVRTMYFEHVLQLPLSYYTGSHSGRLVKVMMSGTSTLWGLWLSCEHLASFVADRGCHSRCSSTGVTASSSWCSAQPLPCDRSRDPQKRAAGEG
jgi:ATP-binding cassette subfamily B protein